jgi:hypothetical protein
METLTCPKCHYLREPRALDCPACGIVFAKYQKTAPPPAALQPLLNPYAAPQSDNLPPPLPGPAPAVTPSGVWRHEGLLIIQQGAELPGRCVACNRSTGNRWRKTFYWSPPGLRILAFLAPLIYVVVVLAVRKRADVAVPLCEEHAEKRRSQVRNSWLVGIGGFVLFCTSFMALADDSGGVFGLLFCLGLVGLLTSALLSSSAIPLQPKKIDGYYAFMKKAGDAFLRTLPSAPMGVGM